MAIPTSTVANRKIIAMRRLFSSNIQYCGLVLAPALLLLLAILLSQFVVSTTGQDLLLVIGTTSEFSPRKIDAIRLVLAASVAVGVGARIVTSARTRSLMPLTRLVVLSIVSIAFNQLLVGLKTPQPMALLGVFDRVHPYIEAPMPISSRPSFDGSGVTTFLAFGDSIDQSFLSNKNVIAQLWHIPDEELLRAVYYMNVVSSLFPYGSADTGAEACVARGGSPRGEVDIRALTIEDYLGAKYGCCSDFVLLLQYLLIRKSYQTKVVVIPGHIMLEVNLSGRSWVLDPSANVAINRSWTRVVQGSAKISALVFAHTGLDLNNRPFYRPVIAFLRIAILSLAASSTPPFSSYSDHVPGYEDVRFK